MPLPDKSEIVNIMKYNYTQLLNTKTFWIQNFVRQIFGLKYSEMFTKLKFCEVLETFS